MKINEKGITIIELMLGTVLFSIIALGVTFFIMTGTTACNNAEETIKVQEESQVVNNQLVNMTIEGNYATSEARSNGDFRYFIYKTNYDTNVTEEEYIIYFQKSSGKAYYYEIDASTSEVQKNAIIAETTGVETDIVNGQFMGEYITDFSVDVTDELGVTFHITYTLNGKTITSKDSVTIRNRKLQPVTPLIS